LVCFLTVNDEQGKNSILINVTQKEPISFKRQDCAGYYVFFRHLYSNGVWCIESFASKNDGNGKIFIKETICSHVFCENHIKTLINETKSQKNDIKCPHCRKILLKGPNKIK